MSTIFTAPEAISESRRIGMSDVSLTQGSTSQDGGWPMRQEAVGFDEQFIVNCTKLTRHDTRMIELGVSRVPKTY